MSTPTSPADLVNAGVAGLSADADRLTMVDNYLRGIQADPYTPTGASAEYTLLVQRSKSNWLPLIVRTPAQALAVSGYRKSNAADDPSGVASPEWLAWQANRMDSRQNAVHYASIAYGQSFVGVQRDLITGQPVIRGFSPVKMYASYSDPASDALPLWALQMDNLPDPNQEKSVATGKLWTNLAVIPVTVTGGKSAKVALGTPVPHGVMLNGQPVCPVVRFAPDIDLEGRVQGVVEPLIPIQDRINQTIFDRLVAQTFSSFKVRTVSGMAPQFQRDTEGNVILDANGQPTPIPIRADASRFFMSADPDTKFDTLDETPLDGLLAATEADVKEMAAVSQTPPHYLLGSLINLSAEALAAAEAGLTRAVTDYQYALGESWELVLGLAAPLAGSQYDPGAQVTWNDFGSRSLSQTVDALGKAAQMLQVPVQALWSRIPGVSATDVEQWADMRQSDDMTSRLAENAINALSSQGGADGS